MLTALLQRYADVARATDDLVASADLDAEQSLSRAPWVEPGAAWSARRVVLHLIAETAQHAGHDDIIREAIDGARTMGEESNMTWPPTSSPKWRMPVPSGVAA